MKSLVRTEYRTGNLRQLETSLGGIRFTAGRRGKRLGRANVVVRPATRQDAADCHIADAVENVANSETGPIRQRAVEHGLPNC